MGLFTALLYVGAALRTGGSDGVSLWRVAQFQALPAAGAALWHFNHEAYLQ